MSKTEMKKLSEETEKFLDEESIKYGNEDYKKYADRKNLSLEFIEWHRDYNLYDYKLYEEFCA